MPGEALTSGDQRVLAEAPSGAVVDLNNLADEERVVSPDVIRRLCVGSEATHVDPRGLRIKGARIVKALDLSFSTVPHPLRFEATTFDVVPDFTGSYLPALWIRRSALPGLRCSGLRLDYDLRLKESEITGEIRLHGAKIGGVFSCEDALLDNEGGRVLSADRAEINGSVYLGHGFSAIGEVRFTDATIRGVLSLRGATLNNESGSALSADRIEIRGSLFLRDGFVATGSVRLLGARIGGNLDCAGAKLHNEDGFALSAERAEIRGSVLLNEEFCAVGEVRLRSVRIGGVLSCSGATLKNQTGDKIALTARAAKIDGGLFFRGVEVTGGVDLFDASAAALYDDLAADDLRSWKTAEPLILEGFAYEHFGHDVELRSKSRRNWLKKTTGFEQSAWRQLIDVYRAEGRDDDATRAAIAMQNDRIWRAGLPWYGIAWRCALGLFIGHGYRPWRAGIWAAAIIASFAFLVSHWTGMFVPAKQSVTGSPQPIAYATDVFLPVIDLGQADDWTPIGWMRWVDWSVILMGWGLTTIFVAGFTRLVRSE